MAQRILGLWPTNADLLASPTTTTVHLEFSSRCNLRCVYCAVSQPYYVGQDMPVDDFDSLVADLQARRVKNVVINGHGETTMLADWPEKVGKLAAAGLSMSIISNFARLMSDTELDAMAQVDKIQISIDTHRPDLLRQLRRKVDVRNILSNMIRVHAAASRLGRVKPMYSWSCVITDKNAFDLVEYVHFALASGVKEITLCNLIKYDDVDDALNVDHVTTMPYKDMAHFIALLNEARAILAKNGGALTVIAGLEDSVTAKLAEREAA